MLMRNLHLLSVAEQVAKYLREEILTGSLTGEMPGIKTLAVDLSINHKTIEAALVLLTKEGLLQSRGAGRRRKIVLPEKYVAPSMRIAILLRESADTTVHYNVALQHQLYEAGHTAFFTKKTLIDLGLDLKKTKQFVKQTNADAWIVQCGSRELLEWFSEQPYPAFAFFGRAIGLPIAATGPNKTPAFKEMIQRLIALGHQRIVMLTRTEGRKPFPGFHPQLFLDELESKGISTGSYNLPDWEENMEGFHLCLESLYQHTPPTALIIEEPMLFHAAQQYLARRGIYAPQHVSLVCLDPEPTLVWSKPAISHIRHDSRPWIRRIVNWANNSAKGKNSRRLTFSKAEFIEGETIGPVPKSKQ